MLNWRPSLPSLRRCRSDKSDRDPKEESLSWPRWEGELPFSAGGALGERNRSCLGREFRTRRRTPVRRVLDRIEAVSPTNVRRSSHGEIGQGPLHQSQTFGSVSV
jgi:hypothetical protein